MRTRAGLRGGHGGRCFFRYGWINGLVNTHQDAAEMPAMQFSCAADVIHCFREIKSATAAGFQLTTAAIYLRFYLVLVLFLYHNATKKQNKKVLKIEINLGVKHKLRSIHCPASHGQVCVVHPAAAHHLSLCLLPPVKTNFVGHSTCLDRGQEQAALKRHRRHLPGRCVSWGVVTDCQKPFVTSQWTIV